MKQTCMNCGTVVDENAKICPGCGRVIMHSRDSANAYGTAIHQYKKKGGAASAVQEENDFFYSSDLLKPKNTRSTITPQQRAEAESLKYHRTGYSGRQNYGRLVPFFSKVFKVLFVIVLIYIAICFLMVNSVKSKSYNFGKEMNLSCGDYNEAVDAYFDEGSWHYSILRNMTSYEGTHDDKKYKLVFKKEDGQVTVDSIIIDGSVIEDKKEIEQIVLERCDSQGELNNKEKREQQLNSIN